MPAKPPKSVEAALAQGYRPLGDLATFRRGRAAFAPRATAPVDCATAAKGTLCFDDHEPDGSHVVGYCDGAGTCQLYTKPGA